MAAPTALSVAVDSDEYSRFETDRNTIIVFVTPTGAGISGEQITIKIGKARRNRDVFVATKTLTLTGAPTDSLAFYLPDLVDSDAASKVRRGSYFIQAVSVTNPTIIDNSSDFLISLISVDKFKKEFLFGADRHATAIAQVQDQPVLITGVTVTDVSVGHPLGVFALVYNYNDPGGGNPIIRTLSWCGGPLVPIVTGKTRYTLRLDSSPSADYITVRIPFVSALPTHSVSEDLIIEREALSDDHLRSILDDAISWVEDVALSVFLEPTIIKTRLDAENITYPAGSDIPTFVDSDYDERVDALTYYRPSAGHWINIRWPYYPLIRINELFGQVANTRIVDVALQWIEAHERGGWVELVPFSQEVSFNFIGLVWVESLNGNIPIPNFWNFTANVGFRDLPGVLLELIGKRAAIDALTIIGQAFRPGIGSQSVSRDGVSESVSYTATAQFGIYSGVINTYNKWLDDNVPMIRDAFRGVNLQVI